MTVWPVTFNVPAMAVFPDVEATVNLFVLTLKSPRTLAWSAKVTSLADRVITVEPSEDLTLLPVTLRLPFTSTSAPESSRASAVEDLMVLPATLRSPASVTSF